ncbi:MAG: hypothetical protein JSS07_04215 [Proteobacteria bacterium]|nr:hypothetical protein [Pseudomonadota bacterium]
MDNWSSNIAVEAGGGGKQIHVNQKENKAIESDLYQSWKKDIERICSNKSLSANVVKEIRDRINTQAMVFYNRASFHNQWVKPDYMPIVNAIISLENRFQNVSANKNLQNEVLEITKTALSTAIKVGDELGNTKEAGVKANQKANQLIDSQEPQCSSKVREEPLEIKEKCMF